METKPNNELFVNKKWIQVTMFIIGIVLTIIGLTQIYCVVFKPSGYEKIVRILGNKYWVQLPLGLLMLIPSYLLFKINNQKNSN